VGVSVTQAALLVAVQSQSRVDVTVTLAVPPVWEIVRVALDAETTQRTPEGATTSVWLVTPPHPAVNSRIGPMIAHRRAIIDACSAVSSSGDM